MCRKETLVECSICREWKTKEILEITGKQLKSIRKKEIACLKCLLVKIDLLMEERRAEGKIKEEIERGGKKWMKSEDDLRD